MIGPFRVAWSATALDDWSRLPLVDGRVVAIAVDRWAATGAGTVIAIEGEYRLFVGAHVVVMLVDGDTLHIDQVRRA
jgi:hypothetical protein